MNVFLKLSRGSYQGQNRFALESFQWTIWIDPVGKVNIFYMKCTSPILRMKWQCLTLLDSKILLSSPNDEFFDTDIGYSEERVPL